MEERRLSAYVMPVLALGHGFIALAGLAVLLLVFLTAVGGLLQGAGSVLWQVLALVLIFQIPAAAFVAAVNLWKGRTPLIATFCAGMVTVLAPLGSLVGAFSLWAVAREEQARAAAALPPHWKVFLAGLGYGLGVLVVAAVLAKL